MRQLASQSLVISIDHKGPLEKVNKAATKTAEHNYTLHSNQTALREIFKNSLKNKLILELKEVPG